MAPTKTKKYLKINFRPLFLDSFSQKIKNIKLAIDPKIRPILFRVILPIYQYNGWPDHIHKKNNYIGY